MDMCLRYVEKKTQSKILEDILSAKLCVPKIKETKQTPLTIEVENQKFRNSNEERKENISLNKLKDKQSSYNYEKEEIKNLSGSKCIKNKKLDEKKSPSKTVVVSYKKKKKVYITNLGISENTEFFENLVRKKKKKKADQQSSLQIRKFFQKLN